MQEAKPVVKLVVVGDADVGKTSIVLRYSSGTFSEESKPTVGAACIEKDVTFDGTEYVLSMWDTAGQETYRNLVPMYFRNTQIAFIVFDVTIPKTAQSIDYWMQSINECCDSQTVIILVANKCDLPDRKVDSEDVAHYAERIHVPYVETSAKTGVGITKLFENAFSEYIRMGKINEKNAQLKNQNEKDGCC